jgi:hypothetical protein
MTSVSNTSAAPAIRDPYMQWCARLGMPVVEDFGLDIRKVSAAPWARTACMGRFAAPRAATIFSSVSR